MHIKTANGKKKIVISRKEWKTIGKKAGWNKEWRGELTPEDEKLLGSGLRLLKRIKPWDMVDLDVSLLQRFRKRVFDLISSPVFRRLSDGGKKRIKDIFSAIESGLDENDLEIMEDDFISPSPMDYTEQHSNVRWR